MALTINGNYVSGLTDWSGVVASRIATVGSTSVTVNSGSGHVYLGLEVVMPAVKRTGNRYMIWAWSNTDDVEGNASGVGLSLWGEVAGSSYWIQAKGNHSEYCSEATDKYRTPSLTYLTNGTDWSGYSGGFTAGQSMKFRLYGQSNYQNINYQCGVGGHLGAGAVLMVFELSADLFV
jgi:hypothetical protein